ncbi:radical SAM family heme chaperone HemW [bacterium]|nr:radical SAM family heme chaperone HemW [bacterium]
MEESFSLYVHVPFCRGGKCLYCDFYSVPDRVELLDDYLDALGREVEASAGLWPPAGSRVRTVFFGGGTPSLLSGAQVASVLEKAAAVWSLDPETEISLEANPEDVSLEAAAGWRAAGVNRLSVGCQSFADRALAGLGRRHDSAACQAALDRARKAGFERLSADLILGGPGCTESMVIESIDTALALGADHLSIYGYHLEATCPAHAVPDFAECEESIYRAQYLAACESLARAGWLHYEMSNWARDARCTCSHNLAYWTGQPYLGLGPSAHSFQPPDRRFWNKRSLEEYLSYAWSPGAPNPLREGEFLSPRQRLAEHLMLGLRLESGASVALVGQILGRSTAQVLRELDSAGLVRLRDSRVRATREGLLVLDSLVDRILARGEFPLDK